MGALFKLQFTIMVAHDGLTDGESDTVSLTRTFGREERIENAIAYLGRYTGSGVFKGEPNHPMGLIRDGIHP
jgi:hypothetical protein